MWSRARSPTGGAGVGWTILILRRSPCRMSGCQTLRSRSSNLRNSWAGMVQSFQCMGPNRSCGTSQDRIWIRSWWVTSLITAPRSAAYRNPGRRFQFGGGMIVPAMRAPLWSLYWYGTWLSWSGTMSPLGRWWITLSFARISCTSQELSESTSGHRHGYSGSQLVRYRVQHDQWLSHGQLE